jgi:hypothetical protein
MTLEEATVFLRRDTKEVMTAQPDRKSPSVSQRFG